MKFFIKWLIILIPLMVAGETKYVDNFAPAGGDGSINHPYNSLIFAFQNLNPGDTLLVRGTHSGNGQIYFGDIELPVSGQPTSRITVMNYENESVVFSVFSQFNIDKDYWSFEGIIFEANNSTLAHMKWLGKNNRFRNCVFRSRDVSNFSIESQKNNLFEFCKVYHIDQH